MGNLKSRLKSGDVFTWYNEYLKAYTACQVINADSVDHVELLFLDWVGKYPLDSFSLKKVKPLYIDAFFQDEKYCVYSVEPIVPDVFLFVTNIEPLLGDVKGRRAHWEDFGWELPYQKKWEKIPLGKRSLFRSLKDDKTLVNFNGREIPRNITEINDCDLEFHNLMELSVFPCVVDLKLKHYHPGLSNYLTANPFITNLSLNDPNDTELDLRDSFVKKLIINLKNVSILYINDDLETLQTINFAAEKCYVASNNKGASIFLHQQNQSSLHPELKNLKQLSITNIITLDVGLIAKCYPDLEILELNGDSGSLYNLDRIRELKNLRKFYVNDFNYVSMNDFPSSDEMMNLKTLQITSVPRAIGTEIIRLYRNKAHRDENFNLSVSSMK